MILITLFVVIEDTIIISGQLELSNGNVKASQNRKSAPKHILVDAFIALTLIICITIRIELDGPKITPWWRHQMEAFSALQAMCAGIHRSPVNSPHKGQWRGALMIPLICAWINGWVNNREADDLRRNHTHYDVIVMSMEACGKDLLPASFSTRLLK